MAHLPVFCHAMVFLPFQLHKPCTSSLKQSFCSCWKEEDVECRSWWWVSRSWWLQIWWCEWWRGWFHVNWLQVDHRVLVLSNVLWISTDRFSAFDAYRSCKSSLFVVQQTVSIPWSYLAWYNSFCAILPFVDFRILSERDVCHFHEIVFLVVEKLISGWASPDLHTIHDSGMHRRVWDLVRDTNIFFFFGILWCIPSRV